MTITASDANDLCVTTTPYRGIMSIGQIFLRKLAFLVKIFIEKNYFNL